MTKTIDISDEAYKILTAHAYPLGENLTEAMDELFAEADHAWWFKPGTEAYELVKALKHKDEEKLKSIEVKP